MWKCENACAFMLHVGVQWSDAWCSHICWSWGKLYLQYMWRRSPAGSWWIANKRSQAYGSRLPLLCELWLTPIKTSAWTRCLSEYVNGKTWDEKRKKNWFFFFCYNKLFIQSHRSNAKFSGVRSWLKRQRTSLVSLVDAGVIIFGHCSKDAAEHPDEETGRIPPRQCCFTVWFVSEI